MQHTLEENIDANVTWASITGREQKLHEAPAVPGHIVMSGLVCDVKSGSVREIIPPMAL